MQNATQNAESREGLWTTRIREINKSGWSGSIEWIGVNNENFRVKQFCSGWVVKNVPSFDSALVLVWKMRDDGLSGKIGPKYCHGDRLTFDST